MQISEQLSPSRSASLLTFHPVFTLAALNLTVKAPYRLMQSEKVDHPWPPLAAVDALDITYEVFGWGHEQPMATIRLCILTQQPTSTWVTIQNKWVGVHVQLRAVRACVHSCMRARARAGACARTRAYETMQGR